MEKIKEINDEIRKTHKLFKVWFNQREISISMAFCTCSKFVCSNSVGAIVHYSPEQEAELDENPDIIGGYLAFRNSVYALVFAKTVEEAIAKVKEEYKEGLNFGGNERKEEKAQWFTGRIDEMSKICKYLNINPDGIFICGEIDPHSLSKSGEFGDCWLSGADSIDSCEGDWIVGVTNPVDSRNSETRVVKLDGRT